MPQQKSRRRSKVAVTPAFAEARDELFHHIMHCGVIDSDAEHQTEWFDETMDYMASRYHELDEDDFAELRVLGKRFCRPPKNQ
jgi:hypothetical protein